MSVSFDKEATTWDEKPHRVERAIAIADAIRDAVPLTGETRVLDFGCGTGLVGFALRESVGHVFFTDQSEGMLDEVRRKIQLFSAGNASVARPEAAYRSAPYDLIVTSMVLHHIPDPEGWVRDSIGRLTSGGYLCVADLDAEDGSFHRDDPVPHNGFKRNYIESAIENAGATVIHSATVYVNKKTIDGKTRDFPTFLIIGKKRIP